MGNLFFPQLSSGAMTQYPFKKTRVTRTITNLLPDGSMIALADPNAGKLVWQMMFNELSPTDAEALQAHYNACYGPYHAFTFLDPADNLLANSLDVTAASWSKDPTITITPNVADPQGTNMAFLLTNTGNAPQNLAQLLAIPASYQYCFSLYAMSAAPSTVSCFNSGVSSSSVTAYQIGANWTRIICSSKLNDSSDQLSVGLTLAPGQQVNIFGPQLEAQIQPSRYRPTAGGGGVYRSSYWLSNSFALAAIGPNLFATSFAIETTLT